LFCHAFFYDSSLERDSASCQLGVEYLELTSLLLLLDCLTMIDHYVAREGSRLACPHGSKFHVCAGGADSFLGCCTSNPCTDGNGLCPDEDLRPSTYNPENHEVFQASEGFFCPKGGAWYACHGE